MTGVALRHSRPLVAHTRRGGPTVLVRVTRVHVVRVAMDRYGPDHVDALRRAHADEGFVSAHMEPVEERMAS